MMNSRSKLMLFRVFQQRERERKKKDETKPSFCNTLTKITMQYIKFSYLERVHALPVLVQVVHEIHDDCKKTEEFQQSRQRVRKNFFVRKKKWAVSKETHFLRFIYYCARVRRACVLCCTKCVFTRTCCTTLRRRDSENKKRTRKG